MVRTLIALLVVLLLPGCAAGGGARSAAPAAAVESAPPVAAAEAPPRHDPRLRAAPPRPADLPSPVVVPIDAAARAALPREAVTVAGDEGRALRCEGVALAALLRAAGVLAREPLRGAELARYVQVDARDGARAVFALAEFDPALGHRGAFLVDRCDGGPLQAGDGPLRLVVPGDARPARWLRQVRAITVIVAP